MDQIKGFIEILFNIWLELILQSSFDYQFNNTLERLSSVEWSLFCLEELKTNGGQ